MGSIDGFTSAWLDSHSSKETMPEGASEAQFAVGIDPGSTTGIVVWDIGGAVIEAVYSATFHKAVELFYRYPDGSLLVVLEAPKKNSFMYGRHTKQLKSALRKGYSKAWSAARSAMRSAMRVGENQREGELLREIAEQHHTCVAVTPSGQKWDAEQCESVLGYPPYPDNPYPNNEHVRDALRLLYNKRIIPHQGCSYLNEMNPEDA